MFLKHTNTMRSLRHAPIEAYVVRRNISCERFILATGLSYELTLVVEIAYLLLLTTSNRNHSEAAEIEKNKETPPQSFYRNMHLQLWF